ncbi:hypothetical protein BDP27DRAFT_1451988 [Rhodocollybia butyracea]|uniref:Uncharacterized protein n=1 Tax=Rhodocollybia butyracea TaxID=206335 RepID=A0A9P5U0Y2_9AGAR|nr:hypothetical protein BDP27DRAFT_1451988 [Rhodocollybia butyracea]
MFLITVFFIGTYLEILVYGAYVSTFIRHVQILVLRRRKLPLRTFIYLSAASFLLFVAATVSIVVDLIFATHIFKNPTEPIDFSGFGKQRIINSGCGMFAMVVSDAFLLYRSYILYNCRLRVVALPLFTFVAECSIGIQSVISLSGSQKNVDPWTDHPQILTRVETIFGSLSAGVNVMCTSNGLLLLRGTDDLLEELKGLIVACMWRSHRRLLATGAPNLQSPSAYAQVGAIIINSAAINLVWLLSAFVTSTISSLVYEVFAGSFACVTALIFSTIIVSASRPSPSESSTPISFPTLDFPQESRLSNATMELSAENTLEADIQPAELFSLHRSNNGALPKEV